MRRLLIVLSLLLLTAALPAAAHAKVRKGPGGLAFYKPPKPLPAGKHGALIWARKLTGPAALKGGAGNRLLLYRSTSATGKAVAVSGTLTVPKGKAPKGGWPVISWAHGTTGIADQCAPSREGSAPLVNYAYPLLQRWLKAGYAVVRTDYEGLGTPGPHPYLIGNSEGRATLDIARAARELEPRLSKTTIISGHSQGGHAALFAAALAPKWTPELKLRGTVAFAPASHLDDQIPLTAILTAPGGGLSGLIADIGRGIVTANPSFDLSAILSDQANALFPQTETQCLPELSAPTSFGGLAPKAIFKDGADLAPLAKLLDVQDPSHLKITTPLLIDQGGADGTVIPVFTDQLTKELAKNGAEGLTYKKYPDIDHAGIVTAAAKDATAWIGKRLK
jgi:pimeloyl-ACP methyl ester carboxylesterase